MTDKLTITTQSGQTIEATAPVIISASRSTDIPAFYAEWFINRLREGYVVWKNPFNQQPMYISFKNTKAIVFWTKNPKPLIPHLHEIDYSEIKFFKIIRSNLKIVSDEILLENIDGIDENYLAQDICFDYFQIYEDYFDSIILSNIVNPKEGAFTIVANSDNNKE